MASGVLLPGALSDPPLCATHEIFLITSPSRLFCVNIPKSHPLHHNTHLQRDGPLSAPRKISEPSLARYPRSHGMHCMPCASCHATKIAAIPNTQLAKPPFQPSSAAPIMIMLHPTSHLECVEVLNPVVVLLLGGFLPRVCRPPRLHESARGRPQATQVRECPTKGEVRASIFRRAHGQKPKKGRFSSWWGKVRFTS